MFKNAIRNIFHYKGHSIAVGIISLVVAAASCIALAVIKTASKSVMGGSIGQRFSGQFASPFGNLSHYAVIALVIVLVLGVAAVILINIFLATKRKKEICTLNVIGMKKEKIALQLVAETMVVTIISAIIGTAVGFALAVPTGNALLRMQLNSYQSQMSQNFGNWQQNGRNQSSDSQTNGNQSGGSQTYGNRSNGNRGNYSNGNRQNNSQANGNQANNNQANNNQTNNGQADNNQANGNGQGSGYFGQGNGGAGGNFGQGQRSAMSTNRTFSTSADLFTILETIGIGLAIAILSSCAAAIAVLRFDPMKFMTNRE